MLDRLDRPYGAISSAGPVRGAGGGAELKPTATLPRAAAEGDRQETGTTMADAVDATTVNNTATMAR